jgi:hypothetical protein
MGTGSGFQDPSLIENAIRDFSWLRAETSFALLRKPSESTEESRVSIAKLGKKCRSYVA